MFADVITVRNGALELQQYDREIAGAPLRTTSIYSDGFWASIHQTTAMFGEANISSRWCGNGISALHQNVYEPYAECGCG